MHQAPPTCHEKPGLKLLLEGAGFLAFAGLACVLTSLLFGMNYFMGSLVGAAVALWGYTQVATEYARSDLSLVRLRSCWRLTLSLALGLPIAMVALILLRNPDVERALGWGLQPEELAAAIGFVTLAAIFATAVEELFFRGLLLRVLASRLGLPAALIGQSALFTLVHALGTTGIGEYRWLHLLIIGYVTGLLFLKTRSLLAPMVVHGLWNASSLGLVAMLPETAAGAVADQLHWSEAKQSMIYFSIATWGAAGLVISAIYFRQNDWRAVVNRRGLFAADS